MIPSPIRRALSTIQKHRVAHLLMGGQACVLYGAAEFSRDLDLALLPDPANLQQLDGALLELDAKSIAVHRPTSLTCKPDSRSTSAAGARTSPACASTS